MTISETSLPFDKFGRLLQCLALAAVAAGLVGCTKRTLPIEAADIGFTAALSTNLVVIEAGNSPQAYVDFTNFPSVVRRLGNIVVNESAQVGSLTVTDGVNTFELRNAFHLVDEGFDEPGDAEWQPGPGFFPAGDTQVKVICRVYFYRLPKPSGAYFSSFTTNVTIRVHSTYVVPSPPPATPPPVGYAVVTNFGGPNPITNALLNLIEGSDGFLYGISDVPGDGVTGTLVKMDKSGANPGVLAPFTTGSAVGEFPLPQLARSSITDNNGTRSVLIGATTIGPEAELGYQGAIYRINEDGSGLAMLKRFRLTANPTEGYEPTFVTAGKHGQVFVTTRFGGYLADNNGTLTRINADGSGFVLLKQFRKRLGALLGPPIVITNDVLFGVGEGEVISPAQTNYTPGTVFRAGTSGDFLVSNHAQFEQPPNYSTGPPLYRDVFFTARPLGGFMQASDGNLYGAHGVVTINPVPQTNLCFYYRLSLDASGRATGMTRSAYFTGERRPTATPLVEGVDGRLYGFVSDGVLFGGTNWLVALNRQTLLWETIQEFANTTSLGAGGLLAASDGAIYGTLTAGGSNGRGFLFRYRPDTNTPAPRIELAGEATETTQLKQGAAPMTPLRLMTSRTSAHAITLATNVPGFAVGRAIALSGDDLAVGVPFDNDPYYRGAVHLFHRSGDQWQTNGVLDPQGAGAESVRLFGYSLSWVSNTLAVGAPGFAASNGLAGAAYVFTRTNNTWQQSARLSGQSNSLDEFGASVAIDGNLLLVGAPGESPYGTNSGGAWAFVRNASGDWTSPTRLLSPTGAAKDYFGSAVALAGNYAVIGAPRGREQQIPTKRGTAHVFQRISGSWFHRSELDSDYTYPGDLFGACVAIAGNRIAVGMPGALPVTAADARLDRRGVVLFVGSNNIWGELDRVVPEHPRALEMFGASAAFNGQRLCVGAPLDPEFGIGSPGSTYVFDQMGNSWRQVAWLQSPLAQRLDGFGFSVAQSGDLVGVSALLQSVTNTISGGAYVYDLGLPRLSLYRTVGGLQLEWLPPLTNFVLEAIAGLGTNADWQPVQPPPAANAVLVQATNAQRYFRLTKPGL